MSKSNTFENDLLQLIFNNVDIADIGDAAGIQNSAVAGSLYLALHTADPGEAGNAEINTIQNSVSYVSGEYCVALVKELTRFPLSTLGLASERNLLFEYPSLPRVYDGAAIYFALGSGVNTPTNSAISGQLNFVWG